MIKSKILFLGLSVMTVLVANFLAFGSYAYANGMKWTSAAGPVSNGFNESSLDHVACTSANFCQAVGYHYDIEGVRHSLIQSYDGTVWSAAVNSDPMDSRQVTLEDLVCVSDSFCQAVGHYMDDSNNYHPLIYTFDGTGWSVAMNPEPVGSLGASLSGVDCISTTFCQAVGSYYDNNYAGFTLVQTYDGTSWSIAATVSPVDASAAGLVDVDCISTTFCQAVGSYVDMNSHSRTLIQAFDGTNWSVVVSSDVIGDAVNAGMGDVTCLTTTFCQAVGFYRESDFTFRSITKSFDGASWSVAAIANQSGYEVAWLEKVDCVSVSFCYAVGSYQDGGNIQRQLTHSFDGTNWSVTTVSEPADFAGGGLGAVSCASAAACHAVGVYQNTGITSLIQSYDGTDWSVTSGLEPAGALYVVILDIDCVSPTACQAVGKYRDADNYAYPLIVSYGPDETSDPDDVGHEPVAIPAEPTTSYVSPLHILTRKSAYATVNPLTAVEYIDNSATLNNDGNFKDDVLETNQNETANAHEYTEADAAVTTAPRHNWWWIVIITGGALAAGTVISSKIHKQNRQA